MQSELGCVEVGVKLCCRSPGQKVQIDLLLGRVLPLEDDQAVTGVKKDLYQEMGRLASEKLELTLDKR